VEQRRGAGVGHFLFLRFTHRPPDPEPGRFEYPPVQNQHERQRDVKSPESGVYSIPGVLPDLTLLGVGPVLRHAAGRGAHDQHRRHGDGEPDQPGDADEHRGSARRPLLHVLYGVGDGPESVQRDGAQVQDGRRAAQHVQRDEDVARDLPESPAVQHLVERRHGQHQHRHHQVGDGQGADQVVGHILERPLQGDGRDDARVPKYCAQDERAEEEQRDHLVAQLHLLVFGFGASVC